MLTRCVSTTCECEGASAVNYTDKICNEIQDGNSVSYNRENERESSNCLRWFIYIQHRPSSALVKKLAVQSQPSLV